jgi:hypothetical protein
MAAYDDQLNEMEEQAKRHLDGMTINRDKMAHNVVALVNTVRAMRALVVRTEREQSKRPGTFSSAFDGIFEDIFKKNQT